MKKVLCNYTCAMGLFFLAAGYVGAEAAVMVRLDTPYDGCRLQIHSDGSVIMSYGVLPYCVQVASGSFDHEDIKRKLSK